MAAAAVALIAGAEPGIALRLGLGMLGLQFAIGSANDLVDAEEDRLVKLRKPIPAGLISRRAALTVCATAAALGFAAAATVRVEALILGAVGFADGLLYDLRLKRTPFAWTAFAVGVGLLPLYAWYGARGSVPPALPGVVALAVVAGAGLALANAYADLDADRRSGVHSIATVLGARGTLLVNCAVQVCVQMIVIATTLTTAGLAPALIVEGVGCALAWSGIGLAAAPGDRARPLVWEIQALGTLVLGTAWLSVLSAAGLMSG